MTNASNTLAEEIELQHEDGDAFSPPEDAFSRLGSWVSEWIIVGLVLMMGAEMVARTVFNWSIQVSNEIGGYALVAITFLSLASGQLGHAYHRVHFVEHRLSPVGRAWLRFAFDAASLVLTVVLLAEFIRFEWITWNSGDVAPTALMPPLWIPRAVMPLGMLMLTWAMLATVRGDWRRIQAARREASHG